MYLLVHILVTPQIPTAISLLIQYLGRYYATYINRTYGKTGSLWEGRHKGCVIDSEQYLLACMRYIELNPVRAGMVDKPSDYEWSNKGVSTLKSSFTLIYSCKIV